MAGRSDVVVCALMLITILLCAQRAQPWSAWAGGGTLLLALLSKEIAIACVILVPALDLLGMRRLEPPRYVPLLLAVIIYLVLRSLTVGAIVGGLPTGAPVSQIVVDLVTAVGFYIARAALPAGLCAYIPALPHGGGYTLAGVIAPLLAIGLGALAWRRGLWPLVFLAIWFFVTLVPSLTVIVRRSASVVLADRYLYVPSVAWCLLLAWVIVRGAELRRIDARWAGLVIVALAALFAAKLIPYTRVWSDNITFWSDVSVKVPHDGLPQRELGTALIERGRLDEAERAFRSALAGSAPPEGRAMTYSNLGNLYRRLDRHDEALQAFAEALKIRPHPVTFHNLGMTLMVKIEKEQRAGDEAAVLRDITSARAAFERALLLGDAPNAPPAFRQEWDAAKTHALLGQVLFSLGDRAGARQHLETALRLQPTGPAADLTRRYLQSIGQ
jgi:Flp pilus assembly protein TadD